MGRPKGSKNKTRAVPTQYDICGETIQELAKDLIKNWHTHLISTNIAFLWKNKEITKKGQNVGATAEKCSAKMKAVSDYDFLITISYPTWQKLTDKAKRALLDHELEHLLCVETPEGETKYKTIPHDCEEFNSIIMRHGLWRTELRKTADIIKDAEKNNE